MKYKGIIYKAYCLQTQKVYIGQTRQDFNKRKRSHINESFNEKHQKHYVSISLVFISAVKEKEELEER